MIIVTARLVFETQEHRDRAVVTSTEPQADRNKPYTGNQLERNHGQETLAGRPQYYRHRGCRHQR